MHVAEERIQPAESRYFAETVREEGRRGIDGPEREIQERSDGMYIHHELRPYEGYRHERKS